MQVALGGTSSHVQTQVRLYRKTKRIEALQKENLRHGHREYSWYIDDDEYWVFKGRFTPEQGALLQTALEAAGDPLIVEQQYVPEDVPAENFAMETGWIMEWRWMLYWSVNKSFF